MTETQEPIVTIEPILGLGEDYEPEIAWRANVHGHGPLPGGVGCYETYLDALLARKKLLAMGYTPLGVEPSETTLAERKMRAIELGYHKVCLFSSDAVTVLKTWPI